MIENISELLQAGLFLLIAYVAYNVIAGGILLSLVILQPDIDGPSAVVFVFLFIVSLHTIHFWATIFGNIPPAAQNKLQSVFEMVAPETEEVVG